MKFKHLFSEGKIGRLVLKNRVVMPAMGTFLASAEGEVTDRQIAYFEERAKGGVGLIITEVTAVDYVSGKCGPVHPRVDDFRYIPMLSRLSSAVHKYGTKIFMQLSHAGRQTDSALIEGMQPVAPSPIPCEKVGQVPRELSIGEIKDLVGKFVHAAMICKMAGMDGVELHGAHGYLINQFMSPRSNRRTDAYGGSFENRMRFAHEIIEGIKGRCGYDYPVIIRVSVDEFIEGGIKVEEGVRVARYMEMAGVDGIHASCGVFDSLPMFIEPTTFDQGWRVYLSEAVRKVVRVPVIAVGVIREPRLADEIIREGRADFVAIGRGLIADPDWCNKARYGKEADIRKCISCMYCLDREMMRTYIGCAINARAGRELEFEELKRTGSRRKVVVVGGGPSGMEAARILAERNFKVVLFEKEKKLGGQLNYANRPRGKEKVNWLIEYLTKQMKDLEVDVRLGRETTVDVIRRENPYAVFIATGSHAARPAINGIDGENVCFAQEVLTQESGALRAKTVAVVGGGKTGCETAEFLATRCRRVYLIEMLADVAGDVGFVDRMDILKRLADAKVEVFTEYELISIEADSVIIKHMRENEKQRLRVDKVVLAVGREPNRYLYEKVRRSYARVYLLGDAVSPRRIADAIVEGFEKAFLLE